jgi:hypothetical protein
MVWQRPAKPPRNARAGSTPAASANTLPISDWPFAREKLIPTDKSAMLYQKSSHFREKGITS